MSAMTSYFTSTDGDATVYAQWNSLVTYDGNGNTSGTVPNPTNFVNAIPGTLATNSGTLAKTNFTFSGWNTAPNGSGTNFTAGASYVSTGNRTLFAQWNLVITYSSNFGLTPSSGSAPSPTTQSNTNAFNLPGQGLMQKTGYRFLGWATTAGAIAAHFPGGASYTPTGSLKLYAIWQATSFLISFDSNIPAGHPVGTGSMTTQSYTSGTAQAIRANAFARTGYTFSGWNTSADGTGISYTNQQTLTLYETSTLYAKWTANTLTINFNAGSGGTGTMSAQSVTAGTPGTLRSNSFVRTGHNFVGWNTASNGSGNSFSDAQSVTLYATMTLYAQWSAQTYLVTYSSNGGTGSAEPTSQNYTFGTPAITSFAAVGTMARTGYSFMGWSTTSTGTTAITTLTPSGNTTLFAIWAARSFSIAFNGNTSSSGSMTNLAMVSGVAKALTPNTFAKTGYQFIGWNTTPAGTGASYTDSASVTLFSDTTTVILFAQWQLRPPLMPTISATPGNTTATITVSSSPADTLTAGAVSSYTVTALDSG